MFLRHITLALLLLATLGSRAQIPVASPKYEVRAVWLTTIGGIDWPHSYSNGSAASIARQQQELRDILDRLQQANVNTVLIQTRVRGTTIYPSDIEPWDGCLSGHPGSSPGYDALQFAIDECHRRGMECHAWVVTIPLGKWNKAGCQHLRKTHPELVKRIGEDGYMDPEHPGTATYLARMCREIVRRYDVDGIHLDYIRYPETWRIKVSRSEGRRNITSIVQQISSAVKAEKPWVKMSCSPVGKYNDLTRYSSHGWNAYHTVCQDAQGWLRDGLMDQLYPMMYFRDNQFFPFAADWQEHSYGRTVVPGLGIYFLDPREGKWQLSDVTRQLHVLRALGMGHTYFRSKFFTDNTKGIYNYVTRLVDPYPALVPPMTWATKEQPAAPTTLQVTHHGSTTTVSWAPATAPVGSATVPVGSATVPVGSATVPAGSPTGLHYNLYASKTFPVDISDIRNLVAQRLEGQSLTIATDKDYYYAVTAVNRYGIESTPLQSWQKGQGRSAHMLSHDNRTLALPSAAALSNAHHAVIESPQGTILYTKPLQRTIDSNRQTRGYTIDISSLPDGVYVVKTLDKRGITHRLGMFTIKR